MTALRERLGQLGTRIAPGAGGFWSWWVSSLQSWLPARWRLLLGVSGARVLLSPQGGQVHVLQAQGAEALLQQSLQAPLLPEALEAALSPRDARLLRMTGKLSCAGSSPASAPSPPRVRRSPARRLPP